MVRSGFSLVPIFESIFCLSSSHNKFSCEIFFPDVTSLFFDPGLKPDLLDSAEIVEFHVMRISGGVVSRWCQKNTREIITITTKRHALGFHTI